MYLKQTLLNSKKNGNYSIIYKVLFLLQSKTLVLVKKHFAEEGKTLKREKNNYDIFI